MPAPLQLPNRLPVLRHLRRQTGPISVGTYTDAEYVFTYALRGDCLFNLGGRPFRFAAGDALLMPPYLTHALKPLADAVTHYIVHFAFDGLADPLRNWPTVVEVERAQRRRLQDCLDWLVKEWHEREEGYTQAAAARMLEVLVIYLRQTPKPAGPAAAPSKAWRSIERALELMHRHYAEPLSGADLSQASGLGEAYFCRSFRAHTGRSPHFYLNQIRLEKAKELLFRGEQNCTQIAALTGFETVHAFSKVFRRHERLSPSAWAKRYAPPDRREVVPGKRPKID